MKCSLIQGFDHPRVDGLHLADKTDIDDFRGEVSALAPRHLQFLGHDQLTVLPAQSNGFPPLLVDQIDDLFVYLPHEDHLHDVHRFAIRHPHPLDELGFFSDPLEHFTDLGSAAMNDDGVKADIFQKDDVEGKIPSHRLLFHRASAIFDHDRFIVKTADIRKGLDQYLGLIDWILHKFNSSKSNRVQGFE